VRNGNGKVTKKKFKAKDRKRWDGKATLIAKKAEAPFARHSKRKPSIHEKKGYP